MEVHCGMLNLTTSRRVILQCLDSNGIVVTPAITDVLLEKLGICNPQYIHEICNEIVRAADSESKLDEVAELIPADLGGLYDQIITRLEDEAGCRLVVAALCLLECSHFGLMENELLDMLGALSPTGYSSGSDSYSQASRTDLGTKGNTMHQPTTTASNHHRDVDTHSIVASTVPSIGPDFLSVYGSATPNQPESSLYTCTSQTQLRPHGGGTSQGTLSDLEDYDTTIQRGPQRSSEAPKSIHAQSLFPPGTVTGIEDEGKLSPKMFKKHAFTHSVTFPSSNELTTNVPFNCHAPSSPEALRKPHKLPSSPTLSLLSAELARKTASPSLSQHSQCESDVQADAEFQEIMPASSSDQQSSNRTPLRSRMIGLEKISAIQMTSIVVASPLKAYSWARLFHRLRPFLRNVGRPGECRWAIGTRAFSRAIHKKYFKHPPTQTFPFSFCTSPTFFGADKDQNLYSLLSHRGLHAPGHHSQLSGSVNLGVGFASGRSGSSMHSDIVHKRFDWWHGRLAGYFSITSFEDRRAEELPYHLARIQDYGRLSHCLVHFPLFERLLDEENVMDLLRLWRCAGGYSNAVSMYQHALAELEIAGASNQEMVDRMQKVALLLHKAEELEAAQQVLVDAIELEVTRLGGRPESMASLTLNITKILSLSCRQQAQYLEPRECLEPEYRLLQFASQSVEFHRILPGIEVKQNLALLLMLLSIHLLHYASLGGSAALSTQNAMEQAQEAAQEASELYARFEDHGQLLETYLHLASTYNSSPRKALEILEKAQQLCKEHFGELNDMMLRILLNIALVYDCKLCVPEMAEVYYRKWGELTAAIYGEEHPSTALGRETVTDFLASHGKREAALRL